MNSEGGENGEDAVLRDDLYERTKALLEPGDIELVGAIVHTDFTSQEDLEMHDATVEIGETIATHVLGSDPDWYVYSGTNDRRFASNQHQGLTIEGDDFVWECQQLLRNGTFDIVFYYEASVDQDALVEAIRDLGFDVTDVQS